MASSPTACDSLDFAAGTAPRGAAGFVTDTNGGGAGGPRLVRDDFERPSNRRTYPPRPQAFNVPGKNW